MIVLGTCGNCGGQVTVPTIWHGIYPPTPSCQTCGATPVNKQKTIEMQRKIGVSKALGASYG